MSKGNSWPCIILMLRGDHVILSVRPEWRLSLAMRSRVFRKSALAKQQVKIYAERQPVTNRLILEGN